MMRKKTIVLKELLIEEVAGEGNSLGHDQGKVIFVERTVPGDIVDVQLFKNKKDWAAGFPIFFHKKSLQRQQPICEHFEDCGGCQWQMLPYNQQLAFKTKQVKDVLERIGNCDGSLIKDIIPATPIYQYRNKIEYTFATKRYIPDNIYNDNKKLGRENVSVGHYAGFHAKGLFDKVVEINTCHLQDDLSNRIRNTVRDFAIAMGMSFYDVRTHTGWIRNLVVRNTKKGEWLLNFVFGYEEPQWQEKLLSHVLHTFPQLTTIVYTINKNWNDSFANQESNIFFGQGYITEQLSEFYFIISPQSFFQTNAYQAEMLYEQVRQLANLTGKEVIYDLYCGTGTIGLFLHKQARKIVGVEIVASAVADAINNAHLNKATNCNFFCGDVTTICSPDFFNTQGYPDLVILDPPRAGLSPKLLDWLLKQLPHKLIYISCNPATQARDIKILLSQYKVLHIQPIDMFPHTKHIENIVVLEKYSL
ncbi:MAG: 23S rRNA (uracil(1939)-C(5))-methyltransferase RlmD [Phycisphaerales bacterium]|nr:23S rRNA (uracil(1939)-C(5))-methyltransferase RlmD [Phycisphaerales bacterium]